MHGFRVENNLYVRQEGTLAYFFELEEVEELFASCGLLMVRSHYQVLKGHHSTAPIGRMI